MTANYLNEKWMNYMNELQFIFAWRRTEWQPIVNISPLMLSQVLIASLLISGLIVTISVQWRFWIIWVVRTAGWEIQWQGRALFCLSPVLFSSPWAGFTPVFVTLLSFVSAGLFSLPLNACFHSHLHLLLLSSSPPRAYSLIHSRA